MRAAEFLVPEVHLTRRRKGGLTLSAFSDWEGYWFELVPEHPSETHIMGLAVGSQVGNFQIFQI